MPAISNITATWDDISTEFTAVKMNVTDTNSSADSKMLDLQVDGSSVFAVAKDGTIQGPVSAFMSTVLDDADAATARATLGISDSDSTEFGTVADLLSDTTLTTGNTTVGDYFKAGGYRYIRVASGGDVQNAADTPVQFDVVNQGPEPGFNAFSFGAVGDGSTDDTEAIQALLDSLEGAGGGVAYFGIGTFVISMAESDHSNACIVVPENVILRGAGKYLTTFTRPSGERGTNGVLFVNKNYDSITDYGADGNITFEHLGITDGATSPNRVWGDLIGFGNADGLLVHHCYFGNHDQHAVDVCRSKNVKIIHNVSNNNVNVDGCATYQVDAGEVWGIFGTAKNTENVTIAHNRVESSYALNVFHFHTANEAKNVAIYDNYIDGTNIRSGGNAIGGDSDCSYENVSIYNNTIVLDGLSTRGINFPSTDTVELIQNLRIFGNTIKGVARTAIYTGAYTPTLSHTDGPLQSVYIYENTINLDISSGNIGVSAPVVSAGHFRKAHIERNNIHLITGTQTQTGAIYFITDTSNQYAVIKDNHCTSDHATPSAVMYGIHTSFETHYDNSLDATKIIKDNLLDLYGCDYHIFMHDPGSMNSYDQLSGVIGHNRMLQSASGANIKETYPLSDGTNNLGFVNFGGSSVATDEHIMAVASGTTYSNLPLTGTREIKDSGKRAGSHTVKILYSPTESGFGNNCETISNIYMSATTCAGIITNDVDLANGNVDLVTGKNGVSMIINDANWEPVLRTSGYIKILCGI